MSLEERKAICLEICDLISFGRSVVELIEDCKSDTYRAVYTVKFKEAIYVLHVFKKKSTKGIATPKKDKELIEKRLKYAVSYHKNYLNRRN